MSPKSRTQNQTPSQSQTQVNETKPKFPWRERKQNVLELWYDELYPLEEVLEEAFKLANRGKIVNIRSVVRVGEPTNAVSITILPNLTFRFDLMLGFRPIAGQRIPNAIGVAPEQVEILETMLSKAKELVDKVREKRSKVLKEQGF